MMRVTLGGSRVAFVLIGTTTILEEEKLLS